MPRTIAARLYLAGAAAALAGLFMAGASLHYAARTHMGLRHIQEKSIRDLQDAAELALLVERHRRIIETAPAVVDRVAIDRDRRLSEELNDEIDRRLWAADQLSLTPVRDAQGWLVEHGRKVLYLAANFAQQAAIEEAARYAEIADLAQRSLESFRAASLKSAEADAAAIAAAGRRLTRWVMAATLAIALVTAFAMTLLRRTVRRLALITRAMLRLARNEICLDPLPAGDADEVGDMARAVAVFRANAEMLVDNRRMLESLNRRFDAAIENMAHGLSMFDSSGRLLVCNQRYADIYGLSRRLMEPGTPMWRLIAAHSGGGGDAEPGLIARYAQWATRYAERAARSGGRCERRRLADGRIIEITCRPIDGGGFVDLHEDVTERDAIEEKVSRLAREDTLTGIANRHSFRAALDTALAATATAGAGVAVHWIDLDHFKEVNDVHGHPAGDALLRGVAQRLAATVRSGDVVGRLGGDEFAVLQRGVTAAADAEALAERLVRVLSAPFPVGASAVAVGGSVGVSLAVPPPGGAREQRLDPDRLMHEADLALYDAKAGGRGRFVVFRDELDTRLRERRRLEADLKGALAAGQLELHYQPIIDLATLQVRSCEALLRWRHPERGMVSPAVFIPVAEDLGLIRDIGAWVIETACREAAGWPEHVAVAVNLSAAQCDGHDLLRIADGALAASGLAPGRLELEVTETLLLKDRAETRGLLHELRARGIAIALDDFGTGYASLSYLRSFPFDKIKIDQTFVREMETRPQCVAIVSSVCVMARALGIRTVAEGVETHAHLAEMQRAGCDEVQGYLFSRPVPAADIQAAIARCGGLHVAAA